jgi:hypothetical protein
MATTINGNTVIEATDYQELDIEVVHSNIATQLQTLALVANEDGVVSQTLAGTAAATLIGISGAATDGGVSEYFIDEIVSLTNAVETDLTSTLPAGAIVEYTQMILNTTVVGDESGDDGLVKVGLGTTADPDKYGKTADLVKDSLVKNTYTPVMLAAEETVTVKAADTNGAAVTEKFVAGGLVRVQIRYKVLNDMAAA